MAWCANSRLRLRLAKTDNKFQGCFILALVFDWNKTGLAVLFQFYFACADGFKISLNSTAPCVADQAHCTVKMRKRNKCHWIYCNWLFGAINVSIVSELVIKCGEDLQCHKKQILPDLAKKCPETKTTPKYSGLDLSSCVTAAFMPLRNSVRLQYINCIVLLFTFVPLSCFIHCIQLYAALSWQLYVQISLLPCWPLPSLARCSCVAILVCFFTNKIKWNQV